MIRWDGARGLAVGLTFGVTVAAIVVPAMLWRRATSRRVALLEAKALPAAPGEPAASPAAGPADLPAPVARYFAFAVPPGTRSTALARVSWMGTFRTRPDAGWRPFTADQHFTASPAGFVWDARIQLLPLVTVRVRDGYVGGEGTMVGRAAGLVTVVDQGGTPEMAAGALARWLGEAVWFPTALLPGPGPGDGVRWEPIDGRTARATVTDQGTAVSAEFHFAPTGEITAMTAMRYRDVEGTGVLTPFEGRYFDYARRNGVMVPTSAEVAWMLPEGRFPYWRGRVVTIAYESATAIHAQDAR